ncbi:MAG: hypothetical protein AUJ55_07090 [Proteobacteria bacterium CG1_02_64_396]|nr:MAG: hypothetical protein AUJ55_07090 [Proteobacteria bacterium CG1_02_64_396]
MAAVKRKVMQKGIRLDGAWYWSPRLSGLVGRQVSIQQWEDGSIDVYRGRRFMCYATPTGSKRVVIHP